MRYSLQALFFKWGTKETICDHRDTTPKQKTISLYYFMKPPCMVRGRLTKRKIMKTTTESNERLFQEVADKVMQELEKALLATEKWTREHDLAESAYETAQRIAEASRLSEGESKGKCLMAAEYRPLPSGVRLLFRSGDRLPLPPAGGDRWAAADGDEGAGRRLPRSAEAEGLRQPRRKRAGGALPRWRPRPQDAPGRPDGRHGRRPRRQDRRGDAGQPLEGDVRPLLGQRLAVREDELQITGGDGDRPPGDGGREHIARPPHDLQGRLRGGLGASPHQRLSARHLGCNKGRHQRPCGHATGEIVRRRGSSVPRLLTNLLSPSLHHEPRHPDAFLVTAKEMS